MKPQNDHTHFKNQAAFAAKYVKCVWPFWDVMHWRVKINIFPAGNYMLKVNNKNTRTRCEISSKLTIKAGLVLVSLLITLNIFHALL